MFLPLLAGAALSGVATAGSVVQHYRRQLGPMTLAEARLLRELPITPIAQCRDGVVKIVATLGCDTPVASMNGAVPTAVREVHYYDVVGRGARAHKALVRVDRTVHPFWIEDDSGRISLDPAQCRIDFETDGTDGESMVEEHRLRLGERVAIIGEVRRDLSLSHHPMRNSAIYADKGVGFVRPPVVTWRTEPEVYPRMLPPLSGLALSAGTVCMAVLGALLQE